MIFTIYCLGYCLCILMIYSINKLSTSSTYKISIGAASTVSLLSWLGIIAVLCTIIAIYIANFLQHSTIYDKLNTWFKS